MIKKSFISFNMMIKQIRSDYMLFAVCFAPIIAGIVFKFFVPEAETLLCDYFGVENVLKNYYFIFDWALILLPGMMYAFAGGLLVLGEADDRISGYMQVTPVGAAGYLLSRLVYPLIIAFVYQIVLISMFSLTYINISDTLILCLSSAALGFCESLFIISLSSNKVEGMAFSKFTGLIEAAVFLPCFLKGSVKYLFSFLPSFWVGMYMVYKSFIYICIAAILFLIWIIIFYKLYVKRKLL